eukprot:5013837-Pleurochrysis_carterae.AAC.1
MRGHWQGQSHKAVRLTCRRRKEVLIHATQACLVGVMEGHHCFDESGSSVTRRRCMGAAKNGACGCLTCSGRYRERAGVVSEVVHVVESAHRLHIGDR